MISESPCKDLNYLNMPPRKSLVSGQSNVSYEKSHNYLRKCQIFPPMRFTRIMQQNVDFYIRIKSKIMNNINAQNRY